MAVEVACSGTAPPQVVPFSRSRIGRARTALLGLLAVAIGFDYFALLRSPAPFVDEAWGANRAWALLQTGRAFGTMDEGIFQRYPGYEHYFLLLETGIHAGAIWLFGPTLFAMRLTSFAFGLVLLAAIYAIGRQLGGQLLGLVAALLVATSNAFLYSSHLGRDDVIVAALGFGAIALYLADGGSGWPIKSLLAGLIVGFSLDVHPNAIIYVGAIGLLCLIDQRWRVWWDKRFWGFALGVGVGVAYFAAIHVLPDPQTYVALGRPFAAWRTPPILSVDPKIWIEALLGADWVVVIRSDLRLPLLIAGLVILGRRGSRPERTLVLLFVALIAAYTAVNRYPSELYGVLILPAADLVIAAWLIRELRSARVGFSQAFGPVVVGLLLTTALVRAVAGAGADHLGSNASALQRLAEDVEPGQSVIGPQTYWFGLSQHRYMSFEQLPYYQLFVPGSTVEDAFQSLHPDYLIVDGHTGGFLGESRSELRDGVQFLYVSLPELRAFLAQNGHLVDSIHTTEYGDILIYRIDWK